MKRANYKTFSIHTTILRRVVASDFCKVVEVLSEKALAIKLIVFAKLFDHLLLQRIMYSGGFFSRQRFWSFRWCFMYSG